MAKKRYTEEERGKLLTKLKRQMKTAPKEEKGKILARIGGLSGANSTARRIVSIKAVKKYWDSPAGRRRKKPQRKAA